MPGPDDRMVVDDQDANRVGHGTADLNRLRGAPIRENPQAVCVPNTMVWPRAATTVRAWDYSYR